LGEKSKLCQQLAHFIKKGEPSLARRSFRQTQPRSDDYISHVARLEENSGLDIWDQQGNISFAVFSAVSIGPVPQVRQGSISLFDRPTSCEGPASVAVSGRICRYSLFLKL